MLDERRYVTSAAALRGSGRWRGLAWITAELARLPRADWGPGVPLVLQGAELCQRRFPHSLVPDVTFHPGLVHLGTLSLLMDKVVAHELRPSAVERVRRMAVLAPQRPGLFKAPFVVEVGDADAGERLFDDTVAIAGYPNDEDGQITLIRMREPTDLKLVSWPHPWMSRTAGPKECFPAHRAWMSRAAPFLTTLALLLDEPAGRLGIREEPPAPSEARDWRRRIVAAE